MLNMTVGDYAIQVGFSPEEVTDNLREFAWLRERLEGERDGRHFIAIGLSDRDSLPDIFIEGWYSPGPSSGFHPGVRVIPETGVAFIGAGTAIRIFSMRDGKLADEEVEVGFWGWERHAGYVLMSAELEFAVWSVEGKKLWSTFVEPPWHFDVAGDRVILNVMGKKTAYDLQSGREAT